MEVIIKGEPKEIAALVLAARGRQGQTARLEINGAAVTEAVFGATHDTPEAATS